MRPEKAFKKRQAALEAQLEELRFKLTWARSVTERFALMDRLDAASSLLHSIDGGTILYGPAKGPANGSRYHRRADV
jgi:hypothetical protein